MTWIQTYTGRQFFPLDPRARDVDIRDIARSLSFLCRFNGHCHQFYSVADHSVRVSQIVPPAHALWGLLHDAAEAYLSDLPRPIKRRVPLFNELEDRLLETIAAAFGLDLPLPPEVLHADDVMLATEARDLAARPPQPWGHRVEPLTSHIVPRSPAEAEQAFLERFASLHGALDVPEPAMWIDE
jgi:hypothetical protein